MSPSKTRLSQVDIEEAAQDYGAGIEPALLWAVADVESAGRGFLADDRPKILFEGHTFWRALRQRGIDPERVARVSPTICYPRWTRRHYLGGAREYDRLTEASAYHREAALESASWGMFQLMGYNFRAAGFDSVLDMVRAHNQSERQHLRAIVRWMRSNGLLRRLAAKDWAAFARGFNGPSYAVNRYDLKLSQAYEKRRATQ